MCRHAGGWKVHPSGHRSAQTSCKLHPLLAKVRGKISTHRPELGHRRRTLFRPGSPGAEGRRQPLLLQLACTASEIRALACDSCRMRFVQSVHTAIACGDCCLIGLRCHRVSQGSRLRHRRPQRASTYCG